MEINLPSFKIIGIAVETTNENNQAGQDMGVLWGRLFSEGIAGKVTMKESADIYSIYTDYESDFTGKYTAVLGFKVPSLKQIPEGLIGRTFDGGKYHQITAKGTMPNAVLEVWQDQWKNNPLNRAYTADFEIHGQQSQNGADSEVEIFISVS